MVEYIYFVKCPNCEDEHFDFFDEAKAYALNCLGDKPVITQVEVCRNDFGECTDSTDLGVKWSWEDMVADTTETPEVSVFSKDDLVPYDPDRDPEFATLDNSLDNVLDNFRKPIAEDFISYYDYDHMNDHMTKEELYSQLVDQGNVVEIAIGDQGAIETQFSDGGVYSDSILKVDFENGIFDVVMWHYSADGDATDDVEYSFSTESFDELWEELLCFEPEVLTECSRKPIPEGMTIEQLVEEMEENEDTVECALCNELFPKTDCTYDKEEGYICPQCEEKTEKCSFCGFRYDPSELRFEVGNGGPDEGLGWLCSRCEAAIKSRGETLTFRETSYWDFLDENVELQENVSLTEASVYDFKYLQYNPDAKEQILGKLDLHSDTYNYVYKDKLSAPVSIPDIFKPSSIVNAGTIVDFEISGQIINLIIEHNNKTYTQDLKTVTRRISRGTRSERFIKAFTQIVKEVNKSSNPGISRVRDINVDRLVNDNHDAAEELKNHIIAIEYEIPDIADYEDPAAVDRNGEPLTDAAREKLEGIHDRFFALPFADEADAAGMVKPRLASQDSNHNIERSWRSIGKITFDCAVRDLSPDAQSLIDDAKLDGSLSDILSKKTIDCVRLANSLINYYGTVRFYETPAAPAAPAAPVLSGPLVADAAGDKLTESFDWFNCF